MIVSRYLREDLPVGLKYLIEVKTSMRRFVCLKIIVFSEDIRDGAMCMGCLFSDQLQ